MNSFLKKNIQISALSILFFTACILLFSVSLFLPVFTGRNGVDGWGAFIFWPVPLFSGDFMKFRVAFAWFANPIWLFAAMLHLFSFHRAALNTAIAGCLIASLFLTFDRLSFGPVGPFFHRDLGSGFYIWFTLFIGLIFLSSCMFGKAVAEKSKSYLGRVKQLNRPNVASVEVPPRPLHLPV